MLSLPADVLILTWKCFSVTLDICNEGKKNLTKSSLEHRKSKKYTKTRN